MRIQIASMMLLTCASCSSSNRSAVSTQSMSEGPIITRIVARHEIIVVRAGANGPTYCVQTDGGETRIPAMTLDELAMKKPDLSHAVRTMQAVTVWAGM